MLAAPKVWMYGFSGYATELKKGEFLIKHLQGRWNISDFFTKPLPTDKFYQFLLFLIVVIDANFPTPKRQTVVMSKML